MLRDVPPESDSLHSSVNADADPIVSHYRLMPSSAARVPAIAASSRKVSGPGT